MKTSRTFAFDTEVLTSFLDACKRTGKKPSVELGWLIVAWLKEYGNPTSSTINECSVCHCRYPGDRYSSCPECAKMIEGGNVG